MSNFERLGVPSVGIVMPNFEKQARAEAALHGLPDLRLVVLDPYVLTDTLASPEQIRMLTDAIMPRLVSHLVGGK